MKRNKLWETLAHGQDKADRESRFEHNHTITGFIIHEPVCQTPGKNILGVGNYYQQSTSHTALLIMQILFSQV